MNIELTDEAVNWFKDELDLPEANKSTSILCKIWWRIST